MDNCVKELYSEGELRSVRKKLWLLRGIAVCITLVFIALCVISCVKADRHYPVPALIRTIIISVIGGWAVITLRILAISRTACVAAHIKAVLEAPREEIEGSFTLTNERIFIKNGVPMRKVRVSGKNGGETVQIYDKKAKLFDARNSVKIRTAYGFITEYEVME